MCLVQIAEKESLLYPAGKDFPEKLWQCFPMRHDPEQDARNEGEERKIVFDGRIKAVNSEVGG